MIERALKLQVEQKLFKGKAIVLYGARQVGKTTLARTILAKYADDAIYLNCDEPDIAAGLSNKTSSELYEFVQRKKLVVIDEGQRVENIGLSIKLLVDAYPDIQIIATGSSSFELANRISEPLTGRAFIFNMYPLSYGELKRHNGQLEASRQLQRMMRFGAFPAVWQSSDNDAETLLAELTTNFLFKDILSFELLRQSSLLTRLLRALALQIGNEVSYNELATLLKVDIKTIERYIFLLEEVFIIFRLQTLTGNARNEVSRLRKVYFYDLGLRNSLIRNHNPLDIRNDTGALWENFCILERLKRNAYSGYHANSYFWRNYQQQEIDYIEEANGGFQAFEYKWNPLKQPKLPAAFAAQYPAAGYTVVSPETVDGFLG